MIGYNNYTWSSNEPQSEEAEERIVETSLLWVVFQSEEDGEDEHQPANTPQQYQAIPSWGLVDVEDFTRVEIMLFKNEQNWVGDAVDTDEDGHLDWDELRFIISITILNFTLTADTCLSLALVTV